MSDVKVGQVWREKSTGTTYRVTGSEAAGCFRIDQSLGGGRFRSSLVREEVLTGECVLVEEGSALFGRKRDIPAHIRTMAAGWILMPNQSPTQREVVGAIEEALEGACHLYGLDLRDVCDALNSKHREGEALVYAKAPELLAMLEELLAVREKHAVFASQLDGSDGRYARTRTLIATAKGESNERDEAHAGAVGGH